MTSTFDFHLPHHAKLLLAAAQFASIDEAKNVLNAVCLRQDANHQVLSISASNGHVLFHARIEQNADATRWVMTKPELLLNAAALRKTCAKAMTATVSGNTIELLDKNNAIAEIRPLPPVPGANGHTYINVDQLFPDSFSNTPGAPIGMNGRYIADIGKAANALSDNATVRMESNGPQQPVVFSFHCSAIPVQLLLMPVKLRD